MTTDVFNAQVQAQSNDEQTHFLDVIKNLCQSLANEEGQSPQLLQSGDTVFIIDQQNSDKNNLADTAIVTLTFQDYGIDIAQPSSCHKGVVQSPFNNQAVVYIANLLEQSGYSSQSSELEPELAIAN